MFGKLAVIATGCVLFAAAVHAKEHPGKELILKEGYQGSKTCEKCHPGKAREFLGTVHWNHASTPLTEV